MIKEDFSNLHMTGKEIFALRRMSFHFHVKCNKTVKNLITHGFADYTKYRMENRAKYPDSDRAKITEKGIAFLKHREAEFVKNYLFDIVNFAIALAALIISVTKQ